MALHSDAQRVKGIRAVCTPFELIRFSLSQLFSAFILFTHVHPGCLDGQQEGLIVIPVDKNLMICTPNEHAVDELLLIDVVHGTSYVDFIDKPSMIAEEVGDKDVEVVILVECKAVSLKRMVEKEHYLLRTMFLVILAEVIHEFSKPSIIFHIE